MIEIAIMTIEISLHYIGNISYVHNLHNDTIAECHEIASHFSVIRKSTLSVEVMCRNGYGEYIVVSLSSKCNSKMPFFQHFSIRCLIVDYRVRRIHQDLHEVEYDGCR